MDRITLKWPLVSTEWLHSHLEAENLIIFDASMPKAGMGEDTLSESLIEGARFMDLKNRWARKDARFPNTMLDGDSFEKVAREMGINKDSALVFYDQHGIYSSARAWYMFRAMGHENAAVLDGGLPAWEKQGYPTMLKAQNAEVSVLSSSSPGSFSANLKDQHFNTYREVLTWLQDESKLVLDARARERFLGTVPEPREGLRSGHIPGSKSLPFALLQEDGKMKDQESLRALFEKEAKEERDLVFSCGSGITACVLALGAELAGRKRYSVYDGSWTEWGSLPELPVERGSKSL